MGKAAKKPPIKLIEIKDNTTAVIIHYADAPKILTDILRLLDLEVNLYLSTINNTPLNLQNESTREVNRKSGSRSWNSITRKISQIEALGNRGVTKEDLDNLLIYLNEFNWNLHKRMNTEALKKLRSIINWNIAEDYKKQFNSFLERIKLAEVKMYKGRKRRINIEY